MCQTKEQAGFKYEKLKVELQNSFDAGNDNFPNDIIEANNRRLAGQLESTCTLQSRKRFQMIKHFVQFHHQKNMISVENNTTMRKGKIMPAMVLLESLALNCK
jgi:hypothetical protein